MKASEVSDEGLAAVLRAIAFVSTLSSDEKEYIQEAADRLEGDETMIIVEGIEVKLWPDNNGGLWYYHPITGKVVRIP